MYRNDRVACDGARTTYIKCIIHNVMHTNLARPSVARRFTRPLSSNIYNTKQCGQYIFRKEYCRFARGMSFSSLEFFLVCRAL